MPPPRADAFVRGPLRDGPLQPGERERDGDLVHLSFFRELGARGELAFGGVELAVHHEDVGSVHDEVELPRHPI